MNYQNFLKQKTIVNRNEGIKDGYFTQAKKNLARSIEYKDGQKLL